MTEAKVRKVLEDYRNGLPRHGDEGELLSEEDRLDYALASLKELEPKVDRDEIFQLVLNVIFKNPMKKILEELPNFMSSTLPNKITEAIIEYLNRGR